MEHATIKERQVDIDETLARELAAEKAAKDAAAKAAAKQERGCPGRPAVYRDRATAA